MIMFFYCVLIINSDFFIIVYWYFFPRSVVLLKNTLAHVERLLELEFQRIMKLVQLKGKFAHHNEIWKESFENSCSLSKAVVLILVTDMRVLCLALQGGIHGFQGSGFLV
jgi:hypothetical protein